MAFPSLTLSGPVGFVALVALFFAVAIDYSSALLPMAAKLAPKLMNTTSPAPAPSPPVLAPALGPGPSSNGNMIDQGIAYILLLLALVLTYMIHEADLPKL